MRYSPEPFPLPSLEASFFWRFVGLYTFMLQHLTFDSGQQMVVGQFETCWFLVRKIFLRTI